MEKTSSSGFTGFIDGHEEETSNASQFGTTDSTIEDLYVPDDVWLRILERLPWPQVIKSRAVCKRWLELIESPEFEQSVSSQPPWLFVSTSLDDSLKEELHAYDPATDRWHNFPLDFLFKHKDQNHQRHRLSVVSSTNGLVYVTQESRGDLLVEVFSPVTRRKRPFAFTSYPRARELGTPVVWSFVGDDRGHSRCHHLLVASSCERWGTRLYCPTDCEWEDIGEGHPKLRDSRDTKYACSIRDEKFFVLVEEEIDAGVDPYGFEQVEYRIVLLGFDGVKGAWEEYSMFPFERAEDAVIVEFHDSLHLVVASSENDKLCIRVYRFLERKRDAWREVTWTNELYPFSFRSHLRFFQLACASAGELLYIVGYSEDSALAGLCDFSGGSPKWRRVTNVPFTTVGFCFCCNKKVDSSHYW